MNTLKDYIINLLAKGKYFFTKQDALSDLGISLEQFKYQAFRLSSKNNIKKIIKHFYMIIPSEYQNIGSLPPDNIIDPLMSYLQQDYYIGLLSAASLYGATEQQPMIFQVITNKITRDIDLKRIRIEFHLFKYCASSETETITVNTGYAKVSKREQTILDLVRFYNDSGYLSNVVSVIKILAQDAQPDILRNVIAIEKTKPVLQRLGYILEILKFPLLAKVVENDLLKKGIKYTLLRPDFHNKNGERNIRWKLIINDSIELT